MDRKAQEGIPEAGKTKKAFHHSHDRTYDERRDALLDLALDETFPASDPVSITQSPVE